MPIFDFSCATENCEEFVVDHYIPLRSSEYPSCPTHGKMERVYSVSSKKGASTFPYVTRNITKDGSPVEVTSPAHLRQLCKEHKVTPRDDNAWITKEHLGVDFRTGQQRYKEGSGLGVPGCWI